MFVVSAILAKIQIKMDKIKMNEDLGMIGQTMNLKLKTKDNKVLSLAGFSKVGILGLVEMKGLPQLSSAWIKLKPNKQKSRCWNPENANKSRSIKKFVEKNHQNEES